MGTVSFQLPDPLSVEAARCLDQACLAIGYDQSPVPTRLKLDNGRLFLTKDANESGYLMVPWPVSGAGSPICLSATLRERPEPYYLVLELARGKLNQVRTLTAEWESIGMSIEDVDRADLNEAIRLLGQAAIDPADPARLALADRVLEVALSLATRLTRSFADQVLHTRLTESGKLNTDVGFRLARLSPSVEQLHIAGSYSAVRLVPDWSAIEPVQSRYEWSEFDRLLDWAIGAGLHVSVGPIIDPGGPLPDWLTEGEGDLPSLAAFTCDFVETVIRRYQDRIQTWQVFTGLNHTDAFGLGEDDRLRLADRLLDAARSADRDGHWVIGLSQPWGDYLVSEDYTYSPLVFADTLMRAGYTLSALDLELFRGRNSSSQSRDPLEVYRILELFSILSVPLEVSTNSHPTVDGMPAEWEASSLHLVAALPQVCSVFWQRSEDNSGITQGISPLITELRQQFIA